MIYLPLYADVAFCHVIFQQIKWIKEWWHVTKWHVTICTTNRINFILIIYQVSQSTTIIPWHGSYKVDLVARVEELKEWTHPANTNKIDKPGDLSKQDLTEKI